jgi:riboflavin kinase/FMN adenylyltransferase
MKIFHNLSELPDFKNTVLTIGSFDGVHTGHQSILKRVKALAEAVKLPSVVITFHPHPRLVVEGVAAPIKLLTLTDEKTILLEQQGMDYVVVAPFTKAFSEQSPEDYIEQFLVKYFKPKYIVIGYDHHFGAKRAGNIDFLKMNQTKFGYEVQEIEKQVIDDIAVSSTQVRKSLERGDVGTAAKLSGHYYSFTGTVVKGQQIGRGIGFPTANISVSDPHKLVPPHGIYAVFVWHKGIRHKGMMYRGDRPVLKNYHNVTIEVNIFNFDKDIYGDTLKVDLVEYLRPDQYFESLEDLVVQLANDETSAKEILQEIENQSFPKVGVVILNYNGKELLDKFLPFVLAAQYANYDVIVADNGSTDGTMDFILEKNLDGLPNYYGHQRIRAIDLKENYGFALGYNKALERLQEEKTYKYFVLLNSDVEVRKEWLLPLIELMESDNTIAAVQPKIRAYQKRKYFEYAGAVGGWIDVLGYPICRGRVFEKVERDRKQYDDVSEIAWASGAAMVIRADLYAKFGGLDADFWAHQEEIDLCWRMRRAGYKIMVEPRSVVFHVGGGTLEYENPKKTYLNFRNNLYLLFKNEPVLKLMWLLPLRLMLDGVVGVRFLFKQQWKQTWAIVQAHGSFYKNIFKLIEKRKAVSAIVEANRIGAPNFGGVYKGSAVFQFYIRGKKKFSELLA